MPAVAPFVVTELLKGARVAGTVDDAHAPGAQHAARAGLRWHGSGRSSSRHATTSMCAQWPGALASGASQVTSVASSASARAMDIAS